MTEAQEAQKAQTRAFDFEQGLGELEALVERLEQGEGTLEAALAEFERGIALARACQSALNQAEQRVRILTEDGQETDFPLAEEDDHVA